MISESLITELASFAEQNQYSSIQGDFSANIECPENFEDDLFDEIHLIIAPTGKFIIWHISEVRQAIVGKFRDDSGAVQNLYVPTQNYEDEELDAMMDGITARILE